MIIEYGFCDSEFGDVLIAKREDKVCWLSFGKDSFDEFKQEFGGNEFKEGKAFSLKQNLEFEADGTEFQKKVWQELLNIPKGKTKSYTEIAENIGNKEGVRAVASAIAKNPISYLIPCHRVISKSGDINQYRWGREVKQKLLESEL